MELTPAPGASLLPHNLSKSSEHPPAHTRHTGSPTQHHPTVSTHSSTSHNQLPTPIHITRLHSLLTSHPAHPDFQFVSYLVNGLQHGFDIGFSRDRTNHTSPNLSSALAHSDFVSAQLAARCERQEMGGPFDSPPFSTMQCSGVGTVPKKNGKLRLIHHLSAPEGSSVNDGISKEDFSLQYVRLDAAISAIMRHGSGALLVKVDIKNAFRLCPVRPADWPLLGIRWKDQYYFDKVLPFGLRSSPFIFDCLATALEWILRYKFSLQDLIHYLDDYLGVCPPSRCVAELYLWILLAVFRYLNIPVAAEKIGGPATTLTFLGMDLDTDLLELRLSPDKQHELLAATRDLLHSRRCTKRKLASVLGKLLFAAQAVVSGRTFLRRLYDLDKATRLKPPYAMLCLPEGVVHDLEWWQNCLTDWNGRSFFLLDNWTPAPDLHLQTDASGSIGWGAYFNGRWIHGAWSEGEHQDSIEFKELYAIVAACATWGEEWARLRILFHCDNAAVVGILKSGTCRAPRVMSLLRVLCLISARFSFVVSAVHVPSVQNEIADALSRGLLQKFRTLAPAARPGPDTQVAFCTQN